LQDDALRQNPAYRPATETKMPPARVAFFIIAGDVTTPKLGVVTTFYFMVKTESAISLSISTLSKVTPPISTPFTIWVMTLANLTPLTS